MPSTGKGIGTAISSESAIAIGTEGGGMSGTLTSTGSRTAKIGRGTETGTLLRGGTGAAVLLPVDGGPGVEVGVGIAVRLDIDEVSMADLPRKCGATAT